MQNIDLWFNDKGTVKTVYTIFCTARLLVTCTEWAPWQPPGEEDPVYRVTPTVGDPPDGPPPPLPAQSRVSEGPITQLG